MKSSLSFTVIVSTSSRNINTKYFLISDKYFYIIDGIALLAVTGRVVI